MRLTGFMYFRGDDGEAAIFDNSHFDVFTSSIKQVAKLFGERDKTERMKYDDSDDVWKMFFK